jgi:hypothetical protein
MTALLCIMAVIGAMAGVVLALLAVVISAVLGAPALMWWAALFAGLALFLMAIVATWGPR